MDAERLQRLRDTIREREAAVLQLETLDPWLASEINRLVTKTAFMTPGHNRQVGQAYSEIAVFQCERQFLPVRIAAVKAHIEQLKQEIKSDDGQ